KVGRPHLTRRGGRACGERSRAGYPGSQRGGGRAPRRVAAGAGKHERGDGEPGIPARSGAGAERPGAWRRERASMSRYLLSEDAIPSAWFNVLPAMPEPLQPPLHPGTKEPVGPDDLAPLFPMGLIAQEVS